MSTNLHLGVIYNVNISQNNVLTNNNLQLGDH